MINIALKYAKKGWYVLPIRYKEKIPILKNWVEEATTDEETIKRWFSTPKNIGVATGQKSGFWVLDVDGEEGADSLRRLEVEHETLPDTITQITGSGGSHYLFRYDERITRGTPGIREGIDIRTDGNQIVVFPSIHPNGNRYEWEVNGVTEIAKAPEWLIQEIFQQTKKERATIEADVAQGERNTKLYKVACKYINEGITGKALHGLIHSLNEERCKPPLPESEVDTIIASAEKFKPTKPLFPEVAETPVTSLLKRPLTRAREYFEQSQNRQGILGYQVGYKELEQKMDGIQSGMYLVGAIANVGKTTWLVNLAKSLIQENRGLQVLFFSIDDHFRKIYFRLLAGESQLEINRVANIGQKVMRNQYLSDVEKESYVRRIGAARDRVDRLLESMVLMDETDGNTIEFIKETTEQIYMRNNKIVVMVDNFHKIRTPGIKGDARSRFTHLSEEMKALSNRYDLPLLMTVELRKLNHEGPPSPDDLKDTVDLHYDCDVAFMLHSESERKEDSTRLKIIDGKRYPIVDVYVQKNKQSDFKGKLEFVLIPEKALYYELNNVPEAREPAPWD